ncbi:UNVERIFIED_CONTAM: hypothetical protein GTU68_066430 [Idotea baltica]|nr:hypothetical protein [Idotea baltica]
MKDILNYLFKDNTLNKKSACEIMNKIANGDFTNSEIASFLTVFCMRDVTSEELSGFRESLYNLSTQIKLDSENAIDLCGTGGTGKNTFNISTISSFVVAAAGIKVIKHGNYGLSSACGSSNLLEGLGVKTANDPNVLKGFLEKTGICFLHAPLFHPAMKHIGPTRKEMGVKTIFNILGPLINPANPKFQLTGVFSERVQGLYVDVLSPIRTNYKVIYDLAGYDEVSLTSKVSIKGKKSEVLSPEDFGFSKVNPEKLVINDQESGVKLALDILSNNADQDLINVIIANSALAIQTVEGIDLSEAVLKAKLIIESKEAYNKLNQLLELSK